GRSGGAARARRLLARLDGDSLRRGGARRAAAGLARALRGGAVNGFSLAQPWWAAAGIAAGAAILLLAARRGRPHATAYLDLWERALDGAPWTERLFQRSVNAQILLLALGCA